MARNAADYGRILGALAVLPPVSIAESLWEKVGGNLFHWRTSGITVPFQDAVIAAVAIENGIESWTRDRQFAMIQRVLPALRLFAEPP